MSECVCIFVRFGCPVDTHVHMCVWVRVFGLCVIRRVLGDGVCIYMFALRAR